MKTIKFLAVLIIFFLVNTSFIKQVIDKDDYYIVVSKSNYTLTIYDKENNFVVEYPAVFGNSDKGDKMVEGDRKTPEGTFHIISKRPHPKWDKFLALDYPTADSYRKFNERKAQGLIPANARIGGSVGIHGTWPKEEFAVDAHQNWTLGCVSTKNDFIREIYNQLPVGTRVEIVK
ncbi:MAG: L,D-transpeptidase [Bacteroidetes bacterium]|nr:L,D-transpeptidase [Bacteroidota bacterium]